MNLCIFLNSNHNKEPSQFTSKNAFLPLSLSPLPPFNLQKCWAHFTELQTAEYLSRYHHTRDRFLSFLGDLDLLRPPRLRLLSLGSLKSLASFLRNPTGGLLPLLLSLPARSLSLKSRSDSLMSRSRSRGRSRSRSFPICDQFRTWI